MNVFSKYSIHNTIYSDTGSIPAKELRGVIEFRNVWFSYTDHTPSYHFSENGHPSDQDWVLKNINLKVAAGETLALVEQQVQVNHPSSILLEDSMNFKKRRNTD